MTNQTPKICILAGNFLITKQNPLDPKQIKQDIQLIPCIKESCVFYEADVCLIKEAVSKYTRINSNGSDIQA